MAVVGSAVIYAEGNQADDKIVGSGLTVREVAEYTVPYLVRTNSALDNPVTILAAPGLPQLGDSYPADPLATVKSRRPRQDPDAPKKWIVEVLYSTETGDSSRVEKDPTLRPPDITWSTNRQQKAIDRDQNNVAIVNSAGEKFDPPLQRDDTRITLSISRNETSFDPAVIISYSDAVNSDPFFGGIAGTWKVSGLSAQTQYEQGVPYWRVTYTFEYNPNGWAFEILDQGANELVSGELKGMFDANGSKTGPTCLNGAGRGLYKRGAAWRGSVTSIADSVAPGVLVFGVADGTVFGPTPFVAKLSQLGGGISAPTELIQVSLIVGNEITCSRGYGGTTPHAFSPNDIIQQQPVYLTFQVYDVLPFSVFGFTPN